MIKCLYLKHVAKILIFSETPNNYHDNLTFILCFYFKHRCIFILFAFSCSFSTKKKQTASLRPASENKQNLPLRTLAQYNR